MTSVVLVDTGGTAVEYVTLEEGDSQQVGRHQSTTAVHLALLFLGNSQLFRPPPTLQEEGECELDLEFEGEVEGECEAEEEEEEEYGEAQEAERYPAVVVEEVPGAGLADERGYLARVFVCNDEAYLMQEVGDEQEVETGGEAGTTLLYLMVPPRCQCLRNKTVVLRTCDTLL